MDLDALKTDDIFQEAGKGVSDENPMNLPQGGESTIDGTSPDQKRNSKGVVHLLHAIGEDNEQNRSENDIMMQKLQLIQVDIEHQKAECYVSQNRTITKQEILVEKLWQEPFVQQLLVGSDQLDVAQYAMSSPKADVDVSMPSKRNQSLDGNTDLKHRSMALHMQIERLCEMFIK